MWLAGILAFSDISLSGCWRLWNFSRVCDMMLVFFFFYGGLSFQRQVAQAFAPHQHAEGQHVSYVYEYSNDDSYPEPWCKARQRLLFAVPPLGHHHGFGRQTLDQPDSMQEVALTFSNGNCLVGSQFQQHFMSVLMTGHVAEHLHQEEDPSHLILS